MVEEQVKRKMVLTESDVTAIVEQMRTKGLIHECRYDVSPEDMHKLMEFVRSFYEGAIETRRTFRTMVIRMMIWGAIAGILGLMAERFGWLQPFARLLTGAPK